ncbi:MAG TPA: IclR family transcriptional regulator [Rectinemataceae bacterium]
MAEKKTSGALGSSKRRVTGFIQSVDRALSILEYFTQDKPEAGVSELARGLGLNKSTAFGLLSTLEMRGYIEQNAETGRYRLGIKALDLYAAKLASFDLASVGHPVLVHLAAELGETVHLAIYDRGEVVYIDKVESDNALRIASYIGKRNPSYCTGVGKCLLAYQPAEEIDRVLKSKLEPRTPRTMSDPGLLRAELDKVRRQGKARDDEEFVLGLVCCAAPIRDREGLVRAAISVSVPTIRASAERLANFEAAVSEAADTISRSLGYSKPNKA